MNPRRYIYGTLPFPEFTPPGLCFAEGDGAGDGGTGGASGDGGTNGAGAGNGNGAGNGTGNGHAPAGPDWNQFISGLDNLNSQLGGKLDGLAETVRQAAVTPEPDLPPPDFDTMTNSELSAHIVGSVTKAVENMLAERLAPLSHSIQSVQTDVTTREIRAEVERLRSGNKDFNDWLPEMRALATEQPSLSVSRLYALVKAENSVKAADLAKRYAPPVPAKPLPFGGFTPGSAGKPGAPPVLDALTAGRDAYREVAERHPGVLAVLNDI